MNKSFDFCISGAGLAGISLALELQKTNASICVFDPKGIASGASGAPIGLANPATGRFASMSWEAEKCMTSLLQNLEAIQQTTPVQFYKRSGILRPALDESIATKMKKNTENPSWPREWVQWLDEREVQDIHPGISCVEGGVWVASGLTIDIPTYLNAAADWLTQNGVTFVLGEEFEKPDANVYIATAGIWSQNSEFWRHLPLVPVKGQTLMMKRASPLSFNHSVSALGYIGGLHPTKFIVGSTYEHQFKHDDIDEEGKEYLLSRASNVLPKLISESKALSQWTSIRASTPNRMPILGNHPDFDNEYIFAGLGSKGLLYSSYCSELLADLLLNDISLPSEITVQRFNQKKA